MLYYNGIDVSQSINVNKKNTSNHAQVNLYTRKDFKSSGNGSL